MEQPIRHHVGRWIVETWTSGKCFLIPNYKFNPIQREPRSQFATIYSDVRVGYGFPNEVPGYIKKFLSNRVK